ncbi:hypothetical protein [Blastococcus sp. CCUG 61487]|uniref:hypothetical protein n=1 Tax=Blastococcus sp. CCUG 61487 TaxID=1840703 RepID=UPI0010C07E08|nr:hypothetical protein [Blastococcus sp. CCUG 61487]TKJ29352.1 hypothetical protein A6V29_19500 [Blastococcus sp. CCUG 61487]
MISMTWTDASTGFPGSEGVAARPAVCATALAGNGVLLAPVAAPVQGTGVPAAIRLRRIDERVAVPASYLQDIAGIAPISSTKHDNSTTLGLHSRRRPQS